MLKYWRFSLRLHVVVKRLKSEIVGVRVLAQALLESWVKQPLFFVRQIFIDEPEVIHVLCALYSVLLHWFAETVLQVVNYKVLHVGWLFVFYFPHLISHALVKIWGVSSWKRNAFWLLRASELLVHYLKIELIKLIYLWHKINYNYFNKQESYQNAKRRFNFHEIRHIAIDFLRCKALSKTTEWDWREVLHRGPTGRSEKRKNGVDAVQETDWNLQIRNRIHAKTLGNS